MNKEEEYALRNAVRLAGGHIEAGTVDLNQLFALMPHNLDSANLPYICEICSHLSDMYDISAEQTLSIMQDWLSHISDKLGAVSPEKYHGHMGWQLYHDEEDTALMCIIVSKTALFCIKNDNKERYLTKLLFDMMSFDGEDVMIDSPKGKMPLRMALEWYAPHTKLVKWLSAPYQWQRWPEFLLNRIKTGTLSRTQLCDDLKITGFRAKHKLVKKLEQQSEKIKKKRTKGAVI